MPHNHYCYLLPSPICLPHLLICTCLISSPNACPPSSVLCWCLLCFFTFYFFFIFAICYISLWLHFGLFVYIFSLPFLFLCHSLFFFNWLADVFLLSSLYFFLCCYKSHVFILLFVNTELTQAVSNTSRITIWRVCLVKRDINHIMDCHKPYQPYGLLQLHKPYSTHKRVYAQRLGLQSARSAHTDTVLPQASLQKSLCSQKNSLDLKRSLDLKFSC